MIIRLTEDFVIENDRRDDEIKVVPAGLRTNVMRYCYLPPWYQEKWPKKSTEQNYYIIYYRSAFHRIPKSICDVAICEGWYYNI